MAQILSLAHDDQMVARFDRGFSWRIEEHAAVRLADRQHDYARILADLGFQQALGYEFASRRNAYLLDPDIQAHAFGREIDELEHVRLEHHLRHAVSSHVIRRKDILGSG